jgi:phosphopantothenoylcysteine decarboxylase/phosphopantothenate--cysteine ligase
MGFAVAAAAAGAGADVTLVAGPVNLETPPGVRRIDVESATQMHSCVHEAVTGADIFIAAAAVADYSPEHPAGQKIKKNDEKMNLALARAPDILASVAALADRPYVVGFAAETENLEENARLKMSRKRLDMIAANLVGSGKGFDVDENALHVIWDGGQKELTVAPKVDLARELVELICEQLATKRQATKGD